MGNANPSPFKPLDRVVLPDGSKGIVASVNNEGTVTNILSSGKPAEGAQGAGNLLSKDTAAIMVQNAAENEEYLAKLATENSDEAVVKRYEAIKVPPVSKA